MSKQFTLLGIITLILAGSLFVTLTKKESNSLSGNVTPQFSGSEVINTSSTIGLAGEVIITNASNTGIWFKIHNVSSSVIYCGAGTNTSTLTVGGQTLAPFSTSTGGDSFWEMWGVRGPVSCLSSATNGVVTFSYTGR